MKKRNKRSLATAIRAKSKQRYSNDSCSKRMLYKKADVTIYSIHAKQKKIKRDQESQTSVWSICKTPELTGLQEKV